MEAPPHHVCGSQPARLLRVLHLVEGDQRVRLRGERRRVLEAELGDELGLLALAIVPLLAGDLAGPAADAVGDVDRASFGSGPGGEALGAVMSFSRCEADAASLDHVDQTRLGLLRARAGVRSVDRQVVDARAGRKPLGPPVVRHPDDRDLAAVRLERLHPRRDERLDGELPRAEETVTMSPALHAELLRRAIGGISTTGSGTSSFNQGMLRVEEPPHQCSATVDVMSTYGNLSAEPIG